ncbi:MAG: bifunctional phosphopantothenoylcysteine decarboxylase/phosphopantothenate--cysteine ligase CoaBC [Granulosicoccus sp.]
MQAMTMLTNKHIVLGVTGGIAAYKSAILARRLIDAGATVRVVMTQGALAFMQPMTFQALTGQPVHTDLLDLEAEAAMGHIELARWADLILIAPASANTLARLAHGMADDLLTTLCLATEAPIYVAPAMNRLMWANSATRDNCRQLQNRGIRFIGPAEGEQACGETGAGRLPEPEAIRDALLGDLSATGFNPPVSGDKDHLLLAGKHLVITAGPTREAIDPVRFISNRSSGKMGFALAEQAISLGASVTLVAGPVSLECSETIDRIDVTTAHEMHAAVMDVVPRCQVFISVAAVSDYRLDTVQKQKIKKNSEQLQLTLVRNPDILKAVAARPDRPFCVGFAAETENVEAHARGKMLRKKLDMIAANHVAQEDNQVFGSDTNALDVYWAKDDGHKTISTAPKHDIARALLALIARQLT